MCRAQIPAVPSCQTLVKAARGVVKKYKRQEVRREMARLRKLLPQGGRASTGQEVLQQTIALIHRLEQELLARVAGGWVPPALLGGLRPGCRDLGLIRGAVLATMA